MAGAPIPRCSSATPSSVAVQVNGKLRDRVEAPADASRDELESLARERPNVGSHLDGHDVVEGRRRARQARQLRRALSDAGAAGVDRDRRSGLGGSR